ncbi:MAG: hypothetical protein V8S74_06480 [Lachnospirales bacterium]
MLSNLKAEYVRKNIDPNDGLMKALGCSMKTAYNKLNGITPITVPEAVKIIRKDFSKDNFSIDYLFADSKNDIA